MIEQPKRSVTRFFIPLIDVLTLLFCVFLIMPATRPDSEKGKDGPTTGDQLVRQHLDDLARIRRLEDEMKALEKEKGLSIKERVAFRILEIDPKEGRLFYRDKSPEPKEIRDQAEAERLIVDDKRSLGADRRELFYLVLYPRDRKSDRPTGMQRAQYESWLGDVQVRFEQPGEGPTQR